MVFFHPFPPVATTLGPPLVGAYWVVHLHLSGLAAGTERRLTPVRHWTGLITEPAWSTSPTLGQIQEVD
ncbi:hypothetical protein SBRY_110184 [Actinacidiphila bryophytorum]|uniref:Uncharacterized protein n=1 Tax=Actinacidiphila bryophytorum TaxID=1436133 RepID=A0A9W4E1R3_9ACTN|nr:hypothetical protein SBRY_110184 [Actinacidiphila bryophytorum]